MEGGKNNLFRVASRVAAFAAGAEKKEGKPEGLFLKGKGSNSGVTFLLPGGILCVL